MRPVTLIPVSVAVVGSVGLWVAHQSTDQASPAANAETVPPTTQNSNIETAPSLTQTKATPTTPEFSTERSSLSLRNPRLSGHVPQGGKGDRLTLTDLTQRSSANSALLTLAPAATVSLPPLVNPLSDRVWERMMTPTSNTNSIVQPTAAPKLVTTAPIIENGLARLSNISRNTGNTDIVSVNGNSIARTNNASTVTLESPISENPIIDNLTVANENNSITSTILSASPAVASHSASGFSLNGISPSESTIASAIPTIIPTVQPPETLPVMSLRSPSTTQGSDQAIRRIPAPLSLLPIPTASTSENLMQPSDSTGDASVGRNSSLLASDRVILASAEPGEGLLAATPTIAAIAPTPSTNPTITATSSPIAATSNNTAPTTTAQSLPATTQRSPTPPNRPSPPLAAPVAIDETYTLGAGDAIAINFFNVPEYSGEYQVLVDGSVNLPVVGGVSVAGMTLRDASAAIAARYQGELRYPRVTINLMRSRPLRVAIAGEVRQPGLYSLNLNENSQFPTVAQAIQAAGGATQTADLRQVELRRPQRGTTQTVRVNLWELITNGDVSQNLALRDGDVLVIPENTAPNLQETGQLADSNLAASSTQPIDVALVGEVARPGAYKLGGAEGGNRPTVTQAIQQAGGITLTADIRQIQVRRPTRRGEPQVINLDFTKLLAGDLTQDILLQQGDVVAIATATALTPEEILRGSSTNLAPTAVRVNVVGEVNTPGAIQLPANTALNQALLSAGGFNRRANRRSVQLLRLNPNGTVTRRSIRIDLDRGVDLENNPVVANGDVIIVGRSGVASFSDGLDTFLNPFFRLLGPLQLLF